MRLILAFCLVLTGTLRAATSLSQYGITWTFNTNYTTGQYANGDYYVVAPSGLTITDISPASTYTTTASGTVTITNASPAVITWTTHGLFEGAPVKFSTTGALPTGITAGTTYYVLSTGLTANTFRISTSYEGAAINTSSDGSGVQSCETGRTKNGSVINPVSSGPNLIAQGWDSAMYSGQSLQAWDKTLNAARPNDATLDAGNPLVVAAGSSLVSSISNATGTARPTLTDAAILTVVASAPSAGSFRPSPYGSAYSHTNGFNKSSLNYSILRSLTPTATTPDLATVSGYFQRPWLEFSGTSLYQYTDPSNNGESYGREAQWKIGAAGLSLHLNYSNATKEELYVRLVQYGIDIYGAAAWSNGGWPGKGGILNGKKFQLVLAALALNDAGMLAYADAQQQFIFSEDMQTFVVQQSDVGRPLYHGDGEIRVEYIQSDVTTPEVGQQHRSTLPVDSNYSPQYDGRNWETMQYRDIIAGPNEGPMLAAILLTGGYAAWNNSTFFAYEDRYFPNRITGGGANVDAFVVEMYNAYRSLALPARSTQWDNGPYLPEPTASISGTLTLAGNASIK